MRRTLGLSFLVALGLLLATVAPALAQGSDDGEGLIGEGNDKIVTFVSLGLIALFPLIALLLSLLQSALDRRKQRRKAASLRRRAGW